MSKSLDIPKDCVRIRSENRCEKCGVGLAVNVQGSPVQNTSRSLHHRQPKRCGGKDSVINLVNLCIQCHRLIHADEDKAATEGWITARFPGSAPFLGWRGWVLPWSDGSLTLLDFEAGRGIPVPLETPPKPRARKRVADRPTYSRGRKPRAA